jgi:hypothetical protein
MPSVSEDYDICSEIGDDVLLNPFSCTILEIYKAVYIQGNLPHGIEIGSNESNKPVAGVQG